MPFANSIIARDEVASHQHQPSSDNSPQLLRGSAMKNRMPSNKERIRQYSNTSGVSLSSPKAGKHRRLGNGPITFPVKLGFNDQDFHGDLLSGYKLNNNGNPYKDNVFVFHEDQVKISYNPKQSSRTEYIKTTKDLERFMEIGASLKLKYGPVTFAASTRYIQDNVSSSQQIVVRHQTRRYAYSTEVDLLRYDLEPMEWVQSNLPDDIAEKYGTSFITKIIWGAQLDVRYSFLSNYKSNAFDIAADAALGINKGGFKLNVEADFHLFQNRTGSSLQLRIETDSIGGNHHCSSAPGSPNEVFKCIDDFNDSFTALIDRMQEKGNLNLNDINNNFVPVAFVIGDIDEHINQDFNKEELIVLSEKMSELGRMFYETIGLKAQLETKLDLQKRLFSSAHDLHTIFEPYEDEADRMLEKIDYKLQDYLDFRRKPFHDIVRGESALPTEFPEDERDEDIINGLLGKMYLPDPVTIGKTSFVSFYFEGFAIPSADGSMKPWMSGELFWESTNKLAATGTSLDELETNGWFTDELGVTPDAYNFDFVHYGHPVYLQSNVKPEGEYRYAYLSNRASTPTVDSFLEGNDGLWSFHSESSSSDQKDGKCLRYGDTILLKKVETIGDRKTTSNEPNDTIAKNETGKWLGYFHPDKNERFYSPQGASDNSFFLLAFGTTKKCPSGNEINTPELCAEAGLSIGGRLRSNRVTKGRWGHTPCGCFLWDSDNAILFDDGNICDYGTSICQSSKSDLYFGKRDDTYDGELIRTSITDGLSLLDFNNPVYYRSLLDKQRKCNAGHEIETLELCKDAGITVGGELRNEKAVKGHWSDTPCGCFTWSNIVHYDDGNKCSTAAKYNNICHFPKEDSVDQLMGGAQWIIRGENHKNSDGVCVQMHSKVYLQNKQYKNLYLNTGHDAAEVDVGSKAAAAHSIWTFQKSTTNTGDDNEGFVCGSVKSRAKWIPVGQSGKQPYETVINGHNGPEIPSTWKQTPSWEASVVSSIAQGFKVQDQWNDEEVEQLYASLLAHMANEAFALGDHINHNVPPDKQAWQFIYDITDECLGPKSSWELNVHEMVFTSNINERPCCLPGLAALEPHGPCKFSSPCFCEASICDAIVDDPIILYPPATSPSEVRLAIAIDRASTTIDRASLALDKALADFAAEARKIQENTDCI